MLVIILGVLLVVAVSVGGYFYWQTQSLSKDTDLVSIVKETKPIQTLEPKGSEPPANRRAFETAVLKVVAQGGLDLDLYEVSVTFTKEEGEMVAVVKRVDADNPFYRGAGDEKLVIQRGKDQLTVRPVFEGVGSALSKKLTTEVVYNNSLTRKPIYRLVEKDVSGNNGLRGSVYTTQYTDDPEICSAFQSIDVKAYPACIPGGLDIFLQDGNHVSIHCSLERSDAMWCDDKVKSLAVSVRKL